MLRGAVWIALILLAQVVTLSLAQTTAETFSACYVPNVGAVYLIKKVGLPASCLAPQHVEFTWNQQGPAGPAGPVGPEGPAGPGGVAPSGAVVFFDLPTCPDGWSASSVAVGRTLVGRPVGGNLGGVVGAPLANLENRTHAHAVDPGLAITSSGGVHQHIWSYLTTEEAWNTYGEGNPPSPFTMVDWGDGVGAEGSGEFPIGYSGESIQRVNWTANSGVHTHAVDLAAMQSTSVSQTMPYAQFLACRKD